MFQPATHRSVNSFFTAWPDHFPPLFCKFFLNQLQN